MSSFNKLQQLISSYFKINLEIITLQTTAHDIDDWDSFSHMDLMNSIENHFDLSIPFAEIMEFNCVGDIARYIDSKQDN